MSSREYINGADMSGKSIKSTIYRGLHLKWMILNTSLLEGLLRRVYMRWWHKTIRCLGSILCSTVLWNTWSYWWLSNFTKWSMNIEWNRCWNDDICRDSSMCINIGFLAWATFTPRSPQRVNRLVKVIWHRLSKLWWRYLSDSFIFLHGIEHSCCLSFNKICVRIRKLSIYQINILDTVLLFALYN